MSATLEPLCPRCQRGCGQMYRVIPEEATNSRVLLRCDGCHHRWSIIVPTASLPPGSTERLSLRSTWPVTP
jgi:flavoprotein